MSLKKLQNLLYPLAAPIVLIGIACLQLYLAHVHDLTPWKGGGFGMFSTVDSQGARFLRIYLLTAEGEFPVEVPPSMKSMAGEIRYLPTSGRLFGLAHELAQASWVSYDNDVLGQPLERLDPQTQVMSQVDDPIEDGGPIFVDKPSADGANLGLAEPRRPRFRVKEKYELGPAADEVEIEGVRVELWRFKFDSRSRQITAHKFLEVTADKAAQASK